MTDHEGIEASARPRLASVSNHPRRHDGEKWVQARRAEIHKAARREALRVASVIFAVAVIAAWVVVYNADFIDQWRTPL